MRTSNESGYTLESRVQSDTIESIAPFLCVPVSFEVQAMSRLIYSGLMLLVAVSMLPGCSFNVSVNAESETDMGSHHVVVKPGSAMTSSTSATFGDDATYTFECGDVSVKIDHEALTVNNLSYGMLKVGQSIEIDHGKVFIAGQERTGKPVEDLEKDEPAKPQAE